MKGFNPTFRKTCGAMLESRGFKRFKYYEYTYYYSVVNDVIYCVGYELLPKTWAKRCRLSFGVSPLCSEIKLMEGKFKGINVGGKYYLKNFTDLDDEFYYTLTEDGLNACMEEMSEYMTKYMFPFFDRADSCKTALSETINLEKILDDVEKIKFKLRYHQDFGGPFPPSFWWHKGSIYYMALKNGEYDYVIEREKEILTGLKNDIQINYDRIEKKLEEIEKKQKEPSDQDKIKNKNYKVSFEKSVEILREEIQITQDHIERNKHQMKLIEEEIVRLENLDVEYYNKMLMENEAKSREVLKEVGLI